MLKTVSSFANSIGALNYKGSWNALTNSPTLTSGVGTKGDYYVVSVAGVTNLDGTALWSIGDWAVFNGSIWQKVDGSTNEAFNSITVTGLTGYMYANNTSAVTASTTIPVANVSGAVANTVNVLAGGLLSGGGALTGNVTISLTSVPAANVSGLGTMATQNANAVVITGGTINSVAHSGGTFASANITSVAATFPNSYLANANVIIGNTTVTLGSTVTTLGNVTLQNVTISSGNGTFTNLSSSNVSITGGTINVQATNIVSTTSSTATFATSSLPLVPAGYIQVDLNGTIVKIPYYAV